MCVNRDTTPRTETTLHPQSPASLPVAALPFVGMHVGQCGVCTCQTSLCLLEAPLGGSHLQAQTHGSRQHGRVLACVRRLTSSFCMWVVRRSARTDQHKKPRRQTEQGFDFTSSQSPWHRGAAASSAAPLSPRQTRRPGAIGARRRRPRRRWRRGWAARRLNLRATRAPWLLASSTPAVAAARRHPHRAPSAQPTPRR